MMNNEEYIFNYDEIKRKFESVPQTNSMTKKFKSTAYKTYFQPRTKSIIGKTDMRSNTYPLMANKIQRNAILSHPRVTLKVHVIDVQKMKPNEQFILQSQQGFHLMSNHKK
ncbi:unnamed protein product [Rotaria sordida]|uniref:Uncharacterized protein n=1 Tax=Rotaria sordida TaxID=392033 RepID=A0A814EQN5_9BILA|nr:unnamed protein product [Rotaria sordida]CAF1102920.1 unnamed protein product [Rotaria sordida]CAF1190423.1 unnamed protein product [Rotaria sordida]CAF3700887.1 unnamed protein product [Rotaria sordida]